MYILLDCTGKHQTGDHLGFVISKHATLKDVQPAMLARPKRGQYHAVWEAERGCVIKPGDHVKFSHPGLQALTRNQLNILFGRIII